MTPEGIPIGHSAIGATWLVTVMVVPVVAIAISIVRTIIVPVGVGMMAFVAVMIVIIGLGGLQSDQIGSEDAGTKP